MVPSWPYYVQLEDFNSGNAALKLHKNETLVSGCPLILEHDKLPLEKWPTKIGCFEKWSQQKLARIRNSRTKVDCVKQVTCFDYGVPAPCIQAELRSGTAMRTEDIVSHPIPTNNLYLLSPCTIDKLHPATSGKKVTSCVIQVLQYSI